MARVCGGGRAAGRCIMGIKMRTAKGWAGEEKKAKISQKQNAGRTRGDRVQVTWWSGQGRREEGGRQAGRCHADVHGSNESLLLLWLKSATTARTTDMLSSGHWKRTQRRVNHLLRAAPDHREVAPPRCSWVTTVDIIHASTCQQKHYEM